MLIPLLGWRSVIRRAPGGVLGLAALLWAAPSLAQSGGEWVPALVEGALTIVVFVAFSAAAFGVTGVLGLAAVRIWRASWVAGLGYSAVVFLGPVAAIALTFVLSSMVFPDLEDLGISLMLGVMVGIMTQVLLLLRINGALRRSEESHEEGTGPQGAPETDPQPPG